MIKSEHIMGYYIDLSTISLAEYRKKLISAYLPPSRKILTERLTERFNYLQCIGLCNVKEVQAALKKKDMMAEMSKLDLFSDGYLKILLREINSLLPKPNKLSEFLNIPSGLVEKISAMGLNNTVKLYPRVLTSELRQKLSVESGVDYETILHLAKLTDLSRVKWVGAKYASMLYELGIDRVEKARQAHPVKLHEQLNRLNTERNYFRGHIGLNDLRIFVAAANDVELNIKFES